MVLALNKKRAVCHGPVLISSLFLVNIAGENFSSAVCTAIGAHTMWAAQLAALRTTYQVDCAQRLMSTPVSAAGFRYSSFRNSTHFNFLFTLSNTRSDFVFLVVCWPGNSFIISNLVAKKERHLRPQLINYSDGISRVKKLLICSDDRRVG